MADDNDGYPPALVPQRKPPPGRTPAEQRINERLDFVDYLLLDGSTERVYVDDRREILSSPRKKGPVD